jgi:hypothetical protein
MILAVIKALYTIPAVIWQTLRGSTGVAAVCVSESALISKTGQIVPANGMVPVTGLAVDLARIRQPDSLAAPCTLNKGAHRLRPASAFAVDPGLLPGLEICRPERPVDFASAEPAPAPAPAMPSVAAADTGAAPAVQPATAAAANSGSQSFATASRDLVAIMTLPSGQAQPQERLFAGDALVSILPYLQPSELANLTRTVARLDLVSEQLRSFLVCHPDPDISSRMLKDAQLLSDVDLLRLIPKAGEQQLRLIARRRMLSMTICDALIATGNKTVILDLLRNADSQLSQSALNVLPGIVRSSDDMMSALCNRQDLPQAVGLKLFWQANRNLRRYLLSRYLTESSSLSRVIEVGISAGAIPPLGGQAKPADIEQLILQIETGNPEAAQTLARCCRIAPETAEMIIADEGGEPLAVVFKAMAQSRLVTAEALKRWVLSPSCAINDANRIIELHALFDSLSYNKARMLLSYWDWASREAGPYTGFTV